ncbi:hypothetical protein ONZ45_g8562 [Pleurotus djamor]|nr:hypothetical protein ONZ45_g8562 [Pleurotus djamor]
MIPLLAHSPPVSQDTPASVLLHYIEGFLLTRASASFEDYETVRRSIRILSSQVLLAENVVSNVDVHSSSRDYIRLRLDAFRNKIFLVFEAHRYPQIVLHAISSLRTMSLEITKLIHNDTFKTITRHAVLAHLPLFVTARLPVGVRTLHTPGLFRGQQTPVGNVYSVKGSDIRKDDKVFLIMGGTGTGKSTFVNAILGSPLAQITNSLEPCTRSVQAFRHVAEDGTKTVVIDTPGFDESCVHDADIINSIAHWMNTLYRNKVAPCGVLFFHSLSANRVGKAPMKNMLLFSKLSGKAVFSNMAIVGTMVDQVDETIVEARLEELACCWESAASLRPHVVPFRNTAASAWDIISGFHNPSPLLISKEMVAEKKLLGETTVGAYLLQILQDIIHKIRPPAYKLFNRWYQGTPFPQTEESVRRLVADLKHQIQVLCNSGRNPFHGKGKNGESVLPINSLAYKTIHISQLHSQIAHLKEFAALSPMPQLVEGVQYASNLMDTLQASGLFRPSIIRLLYDLCHLLSMGLDTNAHPACDDPLSFLISELISHEKYTQRIASTKLPDLKLEAYHHLALCFYATNEARNFLEVDTKTPATGRPMPAL